MRIGRIASITLLAGLATFAACTPSPDAIPESSTGKNATVPQGDIPASRDGATSSSDRMDNVDLTVADLAKLSDLVKSLAGKVVVVDIWSTSCAPCMREFPHLVELSRAHPDKLACVSLNVDYIGLKSKPPESYTPKVLEFLQMQKADQVTNLLSSSTDEAVLDEFQLASIPAILIYAADGSLKHALTDSNTGEDGLSYEGDVIPAVTALLAEQ